MYEARQNKEKVSRRIDSAIGTKQRVKMEDVRKANIAESSIYQFKNRGIVPLYGQKAIQRVKVYVIEDLNLFGIPKTTFLTKAANRVNNKQNLGIVVPLVEEFHDTIKQRLGGWFSSGNPSIGPDINNIDETIVFTSHGSAGWLFGGPTFGGYTPQQLAKILIDGNYLPDGYQGRITLSGCETSVEYNGLFGSGFFKQKSFAELFKNELKNYAAIKRKNLGNFEVKGTLGAARTLSNGKLAVDKIGFQGDWSRVRKKFTYTDGTEAGLGKEVKKIF